MRNIIIYLRVVSNFDAVQKPMIGIAFAIPYSVIRQWVKYCNSNYINTKKGQYFVQNS